VSSVSNGLYFLTLPLVSVTRVIYTSKGMSKKFGVRFIYRKIQYIKSYCVFVKRKTVRSGVLTLAVLKSEFPCDVKLCLQAKCSQHFDRVLCLHFEVSRLPKIFFRCSPVCKVSYSRSLEPLTETMLG
jgi:hypothetical protein